MDAVKTNLLDQLIDSVSGCFTGEAARRLIDLRADEESQQRLDELAAKNSEGTLSPDERAEYEAYVTTAGVVALLQAKARERLSNPAAG